MWLSEKTAAVRQSGAAAGMGPVSIGGPSAAVVTEGEHREVRTIAPLGMLWQATEDSDALLLETGDGERFILGCAVPARALADGEVLLYCGATELRIARDGVHVTGRLTLNGAEISAGEGT